MSSSEIYKDYKGGSVNIPTKSRGEKYSHYKYHYETERADRRWKTGSAFCNAENEMEKTNSGGVCAAFGEGESSPWWERQRKDEKPNSPEDEFGLYGLRKGERSRKCISGQLKEDCLRNPKLRGEKEVAEKEKLAEERKEVEDFLV